MSGMVMRIEPDRARRESEGRAGASRRRRAAAAIIACLVVAAARPAVAAEGWRAFEGSWSASGRRDTLPTEGREAAAIVYLSGALVLTSGEGLPRGFQAEAIGFDDGRGLGTGRAVWTDDRGDRIFSELEGEALETGRRVVGRIRGGTGRYTGITGEFALTWQYVVRAEGGTIQGRTTSLTGRCRFPEAAP